MRELLHRLRYRMWGPLAHEAGNCLSCDRIIAPFQGVRRAGRVFCCEDHVQVREPHLEQTWAW